MVGNRSPPKSFFEALEKARGGAVGGYNRFWLNQGSAYTKPLQAALERHACGWRDPFQPRARG